MRAKPRKTFRFLSLLPGRMQGRALPVTLTRTRIKRIRGCGSLDKVIWAVGKKIDVSAYV